MYLIARQYADLGWTVVPLRAGTKAPDIIWKRYQEVKPTDEELQDWFGLQDRGLGIITGRPSGIVVLDCDPGHGGSASLASVGLQGDKATVRTGGGGCHFYFQYPPTVRGIRNFTGRLPGLDLRGDGGFVVAPPSVHPTTGERYKWVDGIPLNPLPLIPQSVLSLCEPPTERIYTRCATGLYYGDIKLEPAVEGMRNNAAARLAGKLIGLGLSENRAMGIMELWNSDNSPPLETEELASVYRSIKRSHEQNRSTAR